MKKSLFFAAAASALMLTACSSENDVVQNTAPQTTVQNQAVGFDIYTPAATAVTRAGLEGTMTTSRLQRSEYEGGGFGVYAYLVEDAITAAGDAAAEATDYVTWQNRTTPSKAPNFMVNEKLLWNATNQGWYYNPLKYWPNETDYDSQTSPAEMIGSASTSHLDRLTFFAYAPYVSAGVAAAPGINQLTNKVGALAADPTSTTAGTTVEASVGYTASLDDPDKAVDLLWGVAPAGGLTYNAVNGRTVNVPEGEPLIDMTKPDVNTNMKFLFQHALARINVTAVAAIDQIGAGGTLDPNTKITIDEITLTGYFGETGILNLDNPIKNVANWVDVNGVALTSGTLKSALVKKTLTLRAQTAGTDPLAIAKHLRFVGTHASPVAQTDRVGVTTIRQSVIEPADINNAAGANRNWYTSKTYAAKELKYSETTPYYDAAACATPVAAVVYGSDGNKTSNSNFVYTVDSKGVYTESSAEVTLTYPEVNKYYTVPFYKVGTGEEATYAKYQAYTKSGSAPYKYTPKAVGEAPAENDYVIKGDVNKAVAYYDADEYFKRDANFFMVVPTNNFKNRQPAFSAADELEFRTVRVKIKYYITTEDANLNGGFAQTENVIEKDVVFPSIANGKSYNLNLILGLTSVKMEAEVDDWKVINVQADLPQNTAD